METTSDTVQPEAAAPAAAKPESAKGAKMPSVAKAAKKAPQAKKAPKGAPKAKPAQKAAKKAKAADAGPRKGSKSEKVLAMLSRSGGATLKELMKATGWQAHSVRGFLSATVGKKMKIRVLSNVENGERCYAIES